jgi:hypothetical protein
MMRLRYLAVLAVILALGPGAGSIHAEQPSWCAKIRACFDSGCCNRDCCCTCCCPDDYCRKPLPTTCCVPGTCPDDYCRKVLPPAPCCVPMGCVDDYCCKPLPCILPPGQGPCYTCGPPDRCQCPCPCSK